MTQEHLKIAFVINLACICLNIHHAYLFWKAEQASKAWNEKMEEASKRWLGKIEDRKREV